LHDGASLMNYIFCSFDSAGTSFLKSSSGWKFTGS
jgi:hypothetical protein